MLSYCVLSATPAFQFLVTELEPKLGDRANREAFRDYMEHNGVLRDAPEILGKLSNDYFSTIKPSVTITGGQQNESTDMSQSAMLKDIGRTSLKKQISQETINKVNADISRRNNELARQGIDRVYKLDPTQVGEKANDNFTWKIRAFRGKLDIEAKQERTRYSALDKNRLPSPLAQGTLDLFASQPLDNVITESNYSQQIIRKMADAMSQQIGVDYAFITPQEAREITKGSVNPWSGQNAFFFEGKSYFIEGTLTPDDILHEFVHPIMRSIAKQNKALFNGLYDKAALSEEGAKVIEEVRNLYPNLDINGNDFKEEVLVRSLAKIQDLNNKGLQVSSAFEKFVNNLLYAIKQFLRKIFGQKIKVSELSPDTTLKGLSKMLEEGGSFELDPEIITERELVAYKNEYNRQMEGFVAENANAQEIETLTNNLFDSMQKHLVNARNRNDLGSLVDILQNKYKQGELEKMRANLRSYQTLITSDSKQLEDEIELTKQRVEAILNTLGNVDNMAKQFHEQLQILSKDIDNRDNIQKILYIQSSLKYWGAVANTVTQSLENNGVRQVKLLDTLHANLKRSDALIEDFYNKATKDVLWDTLQPIAENIDRKWNEHIAGLIAKNVSPEVIAKAKAEYEKEKITPEQISGAIKGSLKDLNYAQMYLEGISYSPDPLVGGVALAFKNAVTNVELATQRKGNEAATVLKPLVDAVGGKQFKSWELGIKLGQKEKMGHVNPETGEFEEVEKWQFLNSFTGAELARDKYHWKVKQAGIKYQETRSDEDKKALAAIQAEWEEHDRNFFNHQYTEAYYKAYDIIKNDEIGNEARMTLNNLYDERNRLSASMYSAHSDDMLGIADQVEIVGRQIKQLSSLYDIVGELKTGKDFEIAKRLQAFNEATKDMYESHEIPNAFQMAYQAFEQKLREEGKRPGDPLYEDALAKWKEKNSRKAIKDTFWTKMDMISKAITAILSSIPQQDAEKLVIEEAYQVIKDMVKAHRDESGQPLGSEMSPERQEKVKAAQERINTARENLNKLSGLTKQELGEKMAIMLKFQTGQKVSAEELSRLNQLLAKESTLKLDKVQRAELNSLFGEMDELRAKEPTDSYVDTVNDLLGGMNSEVVYDILQTLNIDKSNAYLIGTADVSQKLIELSPEFEEWFNRNHLRKETVDQATNEVKETWERTYAWNVIKPRDEKYYETTKIKNAAGENIIIEGLPSMKYFKRILKDEYLTKKIEGVTVDNRGEWLPKNVEQGQRDGNWDDRYINKDYDRMRVTDPAMFKLLQKATELHLKNQEGLAKNEKLGFDYPRERKHNAERLLSDNPVQRVIQRVKDFFSKVKDGWENGFNWEDNAQLIKMDLFDDQRSGIPMGGMANLPIDEVSTDILYTMMRYVQHGERNKELTKLSPVLRMIQSVLNNPKNHPDDTKMMENRTLFFPNKKKQRYLRQKAINNYIEKVLEGKVNVGWGSESATAQNVSNAIFRRASSSFLDFNIPSALKNALGMKFQGLIEAVGGKYFSTREFLSAEVWATQTAFQISSEIYKQDPKSLDIQLVDIFDPERDRFYQHYGESMVRTPGKDYSFDILKRMTDVRKWVQLQAALQTFGAMMQHEIITTTDGQKISYRDAWELKDGKIQSKANVPAEWGITYNEAGEQIIGDKFKQKRNQIQRVLDNLNGSMGKEDKPEAERYLAFRYVSFFRRFLTSMLTNRFAKNRVDYTLGDTKQGWYITFAQLLANTFKEKGKNLPYMTANEKAATLRMMTEIGTITLLKYLVIPMLFGYDDDDEDRFKKLRAKSGPLPWFGVPEDPSRPFSAGGWLSNHALLLMLQTNGENDQFLPIPGMGLNNYKQMLDIKSAAFGPTVKTLFNIVQDASNMVTGDESAYYKRDIGPYSFQQSGSAKLGAHIAKAIGWTGKTVDGAVALKDYEAIQSQ